jgi:hypothetical protein
MAVIMFILSCQFEKVAILNFEQFRERQLTRLKLFGLTDYVRPTWCQNTQNNETQYNYKNATPQHEGQSERQHSVLRVFMPKVERFTFLLFF